MKIHQRAVIRWNEREQQWEVHVGVVIFYASKDLLACKRWCNDRNIPIRNQGEVNRILYENMPIQEMWG